MVPIEGPLSWLDSTDVNPLVRFFEKTVRSSGFFLYYQGLEMNEVLKIQAELRVISPDPFCTDISKFKDATYLIANVLAFDPKNTSLTMDFSNQSSLLSLIECKIKTAMLSKKLRRLKKLSIFYNANLNQNAHYLFYLSEYIYNSIEILEDYEKTTLNLKSRFYRLKKDFKKTSFSILKQAINSKMTDEAFNKNFLILKQVSDALESFKNDLLKTGRPQKASLTHSILTLDKYSIKIQDLLDKIEIDKMIFSSELV